MLILSTLIAKLKISTQYVLFIRIQVNLSSNIFLTKEFLRATVLTAKAVGTLPITIRHSYQLIFETPVMIILIANSTNQQALPFFRRMAFLAEDTVVAEPVGLVFLHLVFGVGQAVGVERLATQVTRQEVFLVAERAAQITHFFVD